MTIIELLSPFFAQYGIPVLIVSGFIGGEEVIISSVFLSVMGLFPLWWVIVFVTMGEFVSDITIFALGKTKSLNRFKKSKRLTGAYEKADKFITRISKESTFLTILYSKFIYGVRIFTLLYLSSKRTAWKRFLVADILVMSVWFPIVIAISWFAGISAKQLSLLFKHIEITILLLVILIIAIIVVRKQVQTRWLKRQKQLN